VWSGESGERFVESNPWRRGGLFFLAVEVERIRSERGWSWREEVMIVVLVEASEIRCHSKKRLRRGVVGGRADTCGGRYPRRLLTRGRIVRPPQASRDRACDFPFSRRPDSDGGERIFLCAVNGGNENRLRRSLSGETRASGRMRRNLNARVKTLASALRGRSDRQYDGGRNHGL